VGEKSHKPLAGKRVVVTRALGQSQSLVDALREAGAEPVLLPLVAFVPADNLAELDRHLNNSAQFDWLFLTSQNAVLALQERCGSLGRPLAEVFAGVKIAAVGPATAEAVRAAGLAVPYVSNAHNGVALTNELRAEVHGTHVFLPRSDRANPELITVLERHGAKVTPVVAYKTVPPRGELLEACGAVFRGGADAVLFFSPSAVHHLRDLLGSQRFRDLGRQTIFVAIGPVSENALKAESVDRILLATDTTVAAAVSLLADYFAKAGEQQPAGAKQG
jgi:uroporphyrinogen-III synthase